ncbi:MAG: nitronate monooxygenase [Candidatus Dormibacteria bacterium]
MKFDLGMLSEPIVLAPLAGGPSTPELAAAVSNAGGLGFVAGGYKQARALAEDIRRTTELTSRPFGVNLFVPGHASTSEAAISMYANSLEDAFRKFDTMPGRAQWDDDGWHEKLELLKTNPVPVASFTFGCPSADVVGALRNVGTAVWVTVTDVDEALAASAMGADVLVGQGIEAGGHRASFTDRDTGGDLGTLALVQLLRSCTALPLVAAGGIADGGGVAAVLAAGAAAAQIGTAFLRCPEAGTSDVHRRALLEGRSTVITRAFTGRRARGLVNQFIVDHENDALCAYPEVHHLTAPLRAAARRAGDPEFVNLWAGQSHHLGQDIPAADLVQQLGRECRRTLTDVAGRMPPGPVEALRS